jgi:hypothetical protein
MDVEKDSDVRSSCDRVAAEARLRPLADPFTFLREVAVVIAR